MRHSLSPVIHNAAFAASGLDWVYTAFEVAPGSGADAVAAMRHLGIAGLSVTMPHKADVADAVDVLDASSALLHTVNTVVRQPDGRLAGHSTDGAGFVASLLDSGCDPSGMSAVVLGAGGAARAVIDALVRAGAVRVVVVNRTADRAAEAAGLAGAVGSVGTYADIAAADLIVNATSVGMGGRDLPFEVELLRSGQVVADLVYHPLQTALLGEATARGAIAVDGLGMLVHQAVLQQVLWTGVRPDPVVLRAAAEAELSVRQHAAQELAR